MCNNTAATTVRFYFDNNSPIETVENSGVIDRCFREEHDVEVALLAAVDATDDCSTPSARVQKAVVNFDKKCAASSATVRLTDECGNFKDGKSTHVCL